MGLYDTFQTDKDLENNGVVVDYGEFRVTISAAMSTNSKFAKYAENAFKPVRHAMQNGSLSQKRSQDILADIYSKTIVLNWETLVGEEWKTGIESPDGELLEVNPENVKSTLISLPQFMLDLQEQATSMVNFRKEQLKDEAGNS